MSKSILTLDFHNVEPTDDCKAEEFRRVADMIADGYTSGEIIGETSDGNSFSGWWNLIEE